MSFQQWVVHEWASILFVVCFITVLHAVSYGPLKPLSRLTMLVLLHAHAGSASAAGSRSGPGPDAPVWLVFVDDSGFERFYGERRPFNRCALLRDLESVASAKPKVLVVDLDLSPLVLAPLVFSPREAPSAEERQCELKVYGLPERYPKVKFVIVDPLKAVTDDSQSEKQTWKRTYFDVKNVHFADARLTYPLNQAIDYECKDVGLAEIAFEQSTGHLPKSCKAHPPGFFSALLALFVPPTYYPIDYRSYQSKIHKVRAAYGIDADADALRGKTVFFGSHVGRADEALTPLGTLHGVDVHAAKYISFDGEVVQSHKLNFVVDLLIAAAFSALMLWFIGRYAAAPSEDHVLLHARRTWLWIWFVVAFFAFATLLVVVARWLAQRGIMTEPLLIIVGLAIDGLIVARWAHTDPHGKKNFRPWREVSPAIRAAARQAIADWKRLWGSSKRYASAVALREVLFWAVVVAGMCLAFH